MSAALRILTIALTLACAAPAQDTAAVSGIVVNSATGRPMAGALVIIEGVHSYVVESGADGRFHVDAVLPGRYLARPRRDGYTALPPGSAAARVYPRFTLANGERRDGLRLTLVPLGSISGRIADLEGDPIPGASVEALRYTYADGIRKLSTIERARSDDRGDYRLSTLAPGRYFIRATKSYNEIGASTNAMTVRGERLTVKFAARYFPNAAEENEAAALDLAPAGELRSINLQLHTEALYTVRVTAAAPPGANVEKARPLFGFGPASGIGSTGALMGPPYGRPVRFAGNAPGLYEAYVHDRTLGLYARQQVRITNADVDVTLTPAPEVRLTGSVRIEGGGLFALEQVRVTLVAPEAPLSRQATPDREGRFTLGMIQPIIYALRITTPPGCYVKQVRMGERVVQSPRLDLAQSTAPLVITLAGDGGTVEGKVADAQGAPLAGVDVTMVPAGGLPNWSSLPRAATTGDDGTFELRDLAPGEYRALAWLDAEPGAPLDADYRKPFENRATSIRVLAGSRTSIELHAISVSGAQ